MAGRKEYGAADRRKERNLERKRRKQEENREGCGWRESILTGRSCFLQQFSAMAKLPVYNRVPPVKWEEELASQLLHLILLLQHLRASQRNTAPKHAVCFVM